MSELDRLRSLGDQVVPPSFEVLRETARRGTRRNALAASVVAAVAVAAMVAGGAAITSMERAEEPADEPTPRPTPTETLESPAGQRTVVADIGPGDIGGWDLVASRTNTQPGYEGATDLTMVGDQQPTDGPQFCHGDPDTWWVYLVDMGGVGDLADANASFGQCSQADPLSPQPPHVELDPGRGYQQHESYTLRMFVTGPLSDQAQRCLRGSEPLTCPAIHGIEPLVETDAVFGFGDFEEKRSRTVMTLGGLVRYEALAIADGVEYLLDSAVVAADGAEQLVVRLAASDRRRIVGFVRGATAAWESCVEQVGEPAPEVGGFDAWQRELAHECPEAELELRIDGARPAPAELYFTYLDQQYVVPAGEEHVVTVDVVKGDPRFVRYALIIWEERS